jgi:hypothetical protein
MTVAFSPPSCSTAIRPGTWDGAARLTRSELARSEQVRDMDRAVLIVVRDGGDALAEVPVDEFEQNTDQPRQRRGVDLADGFARCLTQNSGELTHAKSANSPGIPGVRWPRAVSSVTFPSMTA